MRLVASALCAAFALVATAGCTSMPGAAADGAGAAETFGNGIEAMPGVDSVAFEQAELPGLIDMTVSLDEAATTADIEEIGVASARYSLTELPPGSYTGAIELHLDDSVYSFFSAQSEQALRGQLAYWHGLAATGVRSASMRSYTAPIQPSPTLDPLSSSTDPGRPVLVGSPIGRYVGIRLDDGLTPEERTAQLAAVRAVEDPGATSGEWFVEGLADRTIIEFMQGPMPSDGELAHATAIAASVPDLGERGSLRITQHADQEAPSTSVSITSFDDGFEGASPADAEARFQATALWSDLEPLIGTLAAPGDDFDVSVVSNTLDDSRNFHLAFGVADCTFVADEDWTTLSDALGAAWVRANAATDAVGAAAACQAARAA